MADEKIIRMVRECGDTDNFSAKPVEAPVNMIFAPTNAQPVNETPKPMLAPVNIPMPTPPKITSKD